MKPGNLHKIAFALFALLLAASCDKEEFAGHPADDGQPQPIRFEIAMASATPSDPSTRVSTSTDGQYTCSFTAGDQVGLYIVKAGAALQSSDNWVDNALLTYDGAKWTCTLPDGKECFPHDGSKLSFYAYYPYDAKLTDPLAMSFSVKQDQSNGLSPSYLMTASKADVSKSHDPVQLTFSHQLALVKVNLKDGDEPKDKSPSPADVVTLKGRQLTTTLNLADDGDKTSGDATDVKMHFNTADSCWYALVPEQDVAAGSGLLTFEWTRILTLKHTLQELFALEKGKVKPLDITIDVDIDPNHKYKVGDIYPYRGFEKGYVFEVSNEGKNGKIASMEDTNRRLCWGPEESNLKPKGDNGRDNMRTVYEGNGNSFDGYPAFKYCHELNPPGTTYTDDATGVWYLPSIAELRLMRALYNEGIGQFDGWHYYMSSESSDDDINNIKCFHIGEGEYGSVKYCKSYIEIYPVRAVMAF